LKEISHFGTELAHNNADGAVCAQRLTIFI